MIRKLTDTEMHRALGADENECDDDFHGFREFLFQMLRRRPFTTNFRKCKKVVHGNGGDK